MFDFYERRKIRQWLYSWPSFVILLAVSVFLAHGVWGVYQQERITRINKNQRSAYLEELKGRKTALEEEMARLNTDRGVEEEIRQKFEVAKEGEKELVIVDPPDRSSGAGDQTKEGLWNRILSAVTFWR